MSRRTIKVEIPFSKPDDFTKLLKKIVEKNKTLGANTPLKGLSSVDMAKFAEKQLNAEKLRAESESFRTQSENKMEQARTIFGTSKGQTAITPGTLYNEVNTIRDFLLVLNKGNEEALGEWGFDVVVKKASTGVKNKPVEPK